MHPAFAPVLSAIRAGPIPAAAAAAGRPGRVECLALGRLDARPESPRATVATLFDLASLTKVLCTAVLVSRDVAAGRIDPDAPLAENLPGVGPELAGVTVRQLVTHTSGLAALSELRFWNLAREDALRRSAQAVPAGPAGEIVYSDQGYILLGWLLERLHGRRLDALAEDLYRPLGLDLRFLPIGEGHGHDRARSARTEIQPGAAEALQGVVHDENAQALLGVAGHAGLFGSVGGVAGLLEALLDGRVLNPDGLGFLTAPKVTGRDGERRAAGWILASPGWFGGRTPATTLGHTGFTGTAAWFDPPSGRLAVFLTNRVCPSRDLNSGIVELRAAFGTAAFAQPLEPA
ncbi:MAG TPA: serine hydrolase domain-containing protein [Deinococcales bacterium]|nr:serine hydrolase domain-containing protein [Deinococcales bacterium]